MSTQYQLAIVLTLVISLFTSLNPSNDKSNDHEIIGRVLGPAGSDSDKHDSKALKVEVMRVIAGKMESGQTVLCQIGKEPTPKTELNPGSYVRIFSAESIREENQQPTLKDCRIEPVSDRDLISVSQQRWNSLKATCENHYSYTSRFSSFNGSGYQQEVEVEDGKVIARRFKSFVEGPAIGPEGPNAPKWDWVEEGDSLNSHKAGTRPMTLDQAYEIALQVSARELADHERRYVRTDRQGLLISCFVIDTRIADDTPQDGITFERISLRSRRTDPNKPITPLQLDVTPRNAGPRVEDPVEINSVDQLGDVFANERDRELIVGKVDFEKQKLLVFSWQGSGRDQLTYDVAESFPEQIFFKYQRGLTRDLRKHTRLFVLRKNVTWKIR